MTRRKTHDEFIREFYSKCDSIEIIGRYITVSTPIECKCKTCGHTWNATPNHLLRGRRCPICANNKRGIHIDRDEFIEKLKVMNPLVELVGDFTKGHDNTTFKCVICSNIWEARPYSILAGHACPLCSCTGTSFSERFIYHSIASILGKEAVKSRYRKLIGKEIDIYIPSFSIAIEYNGWFWHKNKINEDIEKAQLCNNANCQLITIYDSCPFDSLPIQNDYFVFKNDLGSEPNYNSLKSLVIRLFMSYFDLEKDYSDFEWNQIIQASMFDARIKTTEAFKKEFYAKCKTIEVLGDYQRSNIKIPCRCKICNYQWSPTPNGLLRGLRCPNCSGRKKLTHDEFVKKLYIKNDSYRNGELELLDEYISSSHKIKVKCLLCGRIWDTRPPDLLKNHGCGCGKNRLVVGISDLLSSSGDICADWDYSKNSKSPTEYTKTSLEVVNWKCHICGNEWICSIQTRTRGNGKCKKCNKTTISVSKETIESRKTKLIERRGSLADNNPTASSLWHPTKNGGITPKDVTVSSGIKVWWKCTKGHEWQATIANMNVAPYCRICNKTNHKAVPFIDSFASEHPQMLSEWNYTKNESVNPNRVKSGSHNKVWWICEKCGHEWLATINDRTHGHGCPACARENNKIKLHKQIQCKETGEIYQSVKEAKQKTGIKTISSALTGKNKTAGGYHWHYYENTNDTHD